MHLGKWLRRPMLRRATKLALKRWALRRLKRLIWRVDEWVFWQEERLKRG